MNLYEENQDHGKYISLKNHLKQKADEIGKKIEELSSQIKVMNLNVKKDETILNSVQQDPTLLGVKTPSNSSAVCETVFQNNSTITCKELSNRVVADEMLLSLAVSEKINNLKIEIMEKVLKITNLLKKRTQILIFINSNNKNLNILIKKKNLEYLLSSKEILKIINTKFCGIKKKIFQPGFILEKEKRKKEKEDIVKFITTSAKYGNWSCDYEEEIDKTVLEKLEKQDLTINIINQKSVEVSWSKNLKSSITKQTNENRSLGEYVCELAKKKTRKLIIKYKKEAINSGKNSVSLYLMHKIDKEDILILQKYMIKDNIQISLGADERTLNIKLC